MSPRPRKSRMGLKIILVILIGVGLMVLERHLPAPIHKNYGDLFRAAIVLLVGGAISYLVEHWLSQISTDRMGSRRVTSLRFMARLVLYLSIALALLAAFGVGLSSVVFGSAFLTVIIGLAGQSFFSNLIAGIGLVIFHPFEVGDRISFVAWQYPLLMPSYPHEALKPGYLGVVTDINLAYTTMEADDGIPMMIPNGILIQAAIHNQQRRQRQHFRFRFDLDLNLNPERLVRQADETLKSMPYNLKVQLTDLGATTFSLAISGDAPGRREDEVKNEILTHLIPLTQALRLSSSEDANA